MLSPSGAVPARTTGAPVKVILAIALLIFVLLQGHILLGQHGILARYTPVKAFTAFGPLMMADPLTQAGLVDFCVLELTLLVLLANGLPRGRAYPYLLAGFALVSLVYPGLACLTFLLFFWRRFGQFRN